MNKLQRLTPSQWLFVALLGLILAGVLTAGVSFLLAAYKAHTNVQQLKPQIARLQGLVEFESEFAAKAQEAEDRLQGLVYRIDGDASALGNHMQQALRSVFVQAGLSVSGSQLLPVRQQESLTRLRLRVNASGELESITDLLLALAEYEPVVVIDQFELKPERRRRGEQHQRLSVSMIVSSFAVSGD